jgi:cell division septal protein FtsQ
MKPSRPKSRKKSKIKFNVISIRRKLKIYLRAIAMVIFSVGVLSGIYWVFFASGKFNINSINISGTGSYVNNQDLKTVLESKLLGSNILKLNTTMTETVLKDTFRGAKTIKLEKIYPDKINVLVTERQPLAIIYKDDSLGYFLIDDEGYILGSVDSDKTNLPKVKYEGDIKINEFIDRNIVPNYLELMSLLDSEKLSASSVSFFPKYSKIYLTNNSEIYLGNDKNKLESFKVISALLKQNMLEDKKILKIDLRYDKVIVSYE